MKKISGTQRVRLGIVGCGAIAEHSHIPAALACSSVKITALADTSLARMNRLRREFGLSVECRQDYRELSPLVDAVILALPNALHAAAGEHFLAGGVHVLCEKPLAVTTDECRGLCAAATKSGAVLAVGFVTRFFPSTVLTKRLIDARFLGRLQSFDYAFGTPGGWDTVSGYNLTRSGAGGGVLVVSGTHFLDRMQYLFGDVEIDSHENDNRGGVEANCVIDVKGDLHGAPIPGRITLSKTHQLANRLLLIGERGTLEVGEQQRFTVTFAPADSNYRHEISIGNPPLDRVAAHHFFRLQVQDFVRAIRTGELPTVDGMQGLRSVALTERLYDVARPLPEPWCDWPLRRLEPTADLNRAVAQGTAW